MGKAEVDGSWECLAQQTASLGQCWHRPIGDVSYSLVMSEVTFFFIKSLKMRLSMKFTEHSMLGFSINRGDSNSQLQVTANKIRT